MDADRAVSADLVLVALDAPCSHPPPALPCHVTRAGPPPVGPESSMMKSMASLMFFICMLQAFLAINLIFH